MASTSRLRPSICNYCENILGTTSSTASTSTSLRTARKFSTTSNQSRQPQKAPSYSSYNQNNYPPSEFSKSNSSYGSNSSGRAARAAGRSNTYSEWNRFQPKLPLNPDNFTVRTIRAKVESFININYINGGDDYWTLKISEEFGFNREKFKLLAHTFAIRALYELDSARRFEDIEIINSKRILGGKTNIIPTTPQPKRSTTIDLDLIRNNYIEEGGSTIAIERSLFASFIRWSLCIPLPSPTSKNINPNSTLLKLHSLSKITDLRFPAENFPFARQERRKLILHVGPTNSGKTYQALIALARAKTGVYAGPLRLLAHEVFTRFNQGKIGTEGKRVCNLLTGEEQRILDPNASLSSCTVEMFPLNRKLEVGVIDEIQMIGDSQRGTAWTQAILGCQCEELHMCGEESVVELIQKIATELGEELEIKRYTRLSPLAIAEKSLAGDLSQIKRGDCLVTFSRNNIFLFKKSIEEKTGLKVAVAYGGLPPEVREEQARAFNEGKYDVLVASDAVGMGLNLKINRIVFETLRKWDGKAEVSLSMPQIKQIAGRAGRFGVQSLSTTTLTPEEESIAALDDVPPTFSKPTVPGEVTTLHPQDMVLLREAIAAPIIQVTQAALSAPYETYASIRNLLPKSTPFSKVFELMSSLLKTSDHYLPTPEKGTVAILDAIEKITPLTFGERHLFGRSPVNMRDPKVQSSFVGFVEEYARGNKILMSKWGIEVGLFDALENVNRVKKMKEDQESNPSTTQSSFITPSNPFGPRPFTQQSLAELESLHKCITLYLWLSYRLPNIFCDALTARPLRREVELAIEFALEGIKSERIERMAYRAKHNIVGQGPEGRFQGGTDRRDDRDYNKRGNTSFSRK